MKFKDYFLIESLLSELPVIAQRYNVAEAQAFEKEAQEAGMDMAKMLMEFEFGLPERDCKLNYDGRTKLLKKLKSKALYALKLVHETEYKLSQVKKFYGNQDLSVEPHLYRMCDYVRHWLLGVMSMRVAEDFGLMIPDKERNTEDPKTAAKILNMPTATLFAEILKTLPEGAAHARKFKKKFSYNIVYLELLQAKTLPKLLIAISKGLNAEHDRGALVTNSDEENLNSYEPPISVQELESLSNLNYRKLDNELADELAK